MDKATMTNMNKLYNLTHNDIFATNFTSINIFICPQVFVKVDTQDVEICEYICF